MTANRSPRALDEYTEIAEKLKTVLKDVNIKIELVNKRKVLMEFIDELNFMKKDFIEYIDNKDNYNIILSKNKIALFTISEPSLLLYFNEMLGAYATQEVIKIENILIGGPTK